MFSFPVSSLDHSDCDCLLIAVMTKGNPHGAIFASDTHFLLKDLYELFMGDACETLIGKPKLFFVQAIGGKMLDPSIQIKEPEKLPMDLESDAVDGDEEPPFVIPILCDLLIMHFTFGGSCFIQSICEELRNNHSTDDLLMMLTGVNRKVALEQQQMPEIMSMLTKTFHIRKRN